MPVYQNSCQKKKSLKFLMLHRYFAFFSSKYFNLIVILSTLKSTSLDENIRCASKWLILTKRTQNLESVNLKCVSYARSIPVPLKTCTWGLEKCQVPTPNKATLYYTAKLLFHQSPTRHGHYNCDCSLVLDTVTVTTEQ